MLILWALSMPAMFGNLWGGVSVLIIMPVLADRDRLNEEMESTQSKSPNCLTARLSSNAFRYAKIFLLSCMMPCRVHVLWNRSIRGLLFGLFTIYCVPADFIPQFFLLKRQGSGIPKKFFVPGFTQHRIARSQIIGN